MNLGQKSKLPYTSIKLKITQIFDKLNGFFFSSYIMNVTTKGILIFIPFMFLRYKHKIWLSISLVICVFLKRNMVAHCCGDMCFEDNAINFSGEYSC
jgi:hypothetical protein